MSEPSPDHASARQLVRDTVFSEAFRRATFGGVTRGSDSPWARVSLRPIQLRGERHLRFSYFDGRKDITKNARNEEARTRLEELLVLTFAGIHITTSEEEIDIRTTRKGQVHIGRRKAISEGSTPSDSDIAGHNRIKEVPLPEGRSNRLLEAMGILTSDGRVRPTMRAKYTQINEFLKQLSHAADIEALRSPDRPVEILDCGCGSSHLTLAVHHYLNDQLGIPARITGVDVNDEVIRKSTERASRLGADGLDFACGRIRQVEVRPDIVLALHACDTATDDAIAQAIRTKAKLLLCVPCCHKNLNKTIRADGSAGVFRSVLRHGILRQRMADLITDSLRAQILRIMGYRTEIVEFVSTEHTARNLMIRAVLGGPHSRADDVQEYRELCRFWNVTPYLEKLLGDEFQLLLNGASPTANEAGDPIPQS
jgi:hypothetical protein